MICIVCEVSPVSISALWPRAVLVPSQSLPLGAWLCMLLMVGIRLSHMTLPRVESCTNLSCLRPSKNACRTLALHFLDNLTTCEAMVLFPSSVSPTLKDKVACGPCNASPFNGWSCMHRGVKALAPSSSRTCLTMLLQACLN